MTRPLLELRGIDKSFGSVKAGSAPAIDRKKGFEEGLKTHPEMKIIASQSGDFRRSNGKEVMEALLKKHGKEMPKRMVVEDKLFDTTTAKDVIATRSTESRHRA